MSRLLFILVSSVLGVFQAVAAHPHGGFYTGVLTAEFSGVYRMDEHGIGVVWLTVDDNGVVSTPQGMDGTVDDNGAITWEQPNELSFTTGQITDGSVLSEVTISQNGLNSTYRIRAELATGGLGAHVAAELEPISDYPNRSEVRDVLYDGQRFVSVTEDRTVLFSSDGLDWQENPLPATNTLNAIAYGNGQYVVVGDDVNFWLSEDDGLANWTLIQSPSVTISGFTDFVDVAFGNGRFVMVSELGRVYSSVDGLDWSEVATVASVGYSVAFINGRFVVLGSQGLVDLTITSTDGVSWSTASNVGGGLPSSAGLEMAFGNGVYVIPYGSSKKVAVSADASTWTVHNVGVDIRGIVFDGVNFVGINNGVTSSDAITWGGGGNSGSTREGIAFGNSTYVAVGNEIAVATDPAAWTTVSTTLIGRFDVNDTFHTELVTGNGVAVIRGNLGTMLWSTTGQPDDWHLAETEDGVNPPLNIVFGNGMFVSANSGDLVASVDGRHWRRLAGMYAVTRIHFANGRFLAYGASFGRDVIFESLDAVNWIVHFRDLGTGPSAFNTIVYSHGHYVAMSGRSVYRSADAITWTETLNVGAEGVGIAVGNDRVMATGTNVGIGQNGVRVFVSDDGGETWQNRFPVIDNDRPDAIAFVDGRFVITTQPRGSGVSSIISSFDGVDWTEEDPHSEDTLNRIVPWGRGMFLLGESNTLLAHTFSTSLDPEITVQPTNVEAEVGDSAEITVAVAGDGPYYYQWLLNGRPVVNSTTVSGANSATLTLLDLTAEQLGEYRLSITGPNGGGELSNSVSVGDPIVPGFIVQPRSLMGNEGQSVTFTVEVTDGSATLTWYKGETVVGTGTTLSLDALQKSDAGAYHVVMSVPGLPDVTSDIAMLSVMSTATGPVQIVESPLDQTVRVGDDAIIGAAVTVPGGYAIRWYKNDVQVPSSADNNFTARSRTYLELPDVDEDDAGRYKLLVLWNGNFFTQEMTLTVSPPTHQTGGALDAGGNPNPIDGGPVQFDLLDGKTWNWDGTSNSFTRRNGDGSVDGSYDPDVSFHTIHDVTTDAAGNIYVAGLGTTSSGGASDRWSLVRLDTNGVRDATFNTGGGFANGAANVHAVEILPDGRIIAAGRFNAYDGVAVYNHVIMLPATGAIDPEFVGAGESGGGGAAIYDIHLASDGTILLAGSIGVFPGSLHGHLVKIDMNGNVVPGVVTPLAFNAGFVKTGGTASIFSIAETLGTIIVVGDFTSFGGEPANNIAAVRLDDGQIDRRFDFGAGFNGVVNDLDLSFTGDIAVRGSFTQYDGVNVAGGVAALHGLGIDLVITQQPAPVIVEAGNGFELSVAVYSESAVEYQWRKDLVEIPGADGATLSIPAASAGDSGRYYCVVTNLSSEVKTLAVNVRVLAAPEFDDQPEGARVALGRPVTLEAVVLGAGNISFQWLRNGAEVSGAVGSTLQLPAVGPGDVGRYQLRAMNSFGTTLSANADVTLEQVGFAVVDPAFDAGSGISGDVYAFLPLANGDTIVAGNFFEYNDAAATSIIRIDGAGHRVESFDTQGFNSGATVYAMALQNDGKIIVAGEFSEYDGVAVPNIVRIDGNGARDPSFVPPAGVFDNRIYDLALNGDDIIVVGEFFAGVVRLGIDGTHDPSFTVAQGARAFPVYTVEVLAGGQIAVGGGFFNYGGNPFADSIVLLNPTTGAIEATSTLANQLSGIRDIVAQPDGKFLAVGDFGALVQFGADLSVDLNYPPVADQITVPSARSITLLADGTIIVGGTSSSQAITAFDANGVHLPDFPTYVRSIYALAIDSAGRLLIGGGFIAPEAQTRSGISRFVMGASLGIVDLSGDTEVAAGGTAELRVIAVGTGTLTYQWFRGTSGDDSTPIVGATEQDLVDGPINEDRDYWVRVSDDNGTTDSATVTITLTRPPNFVVQPQSLSVFAGTRARFRAVVEGIEPIQFQWMHNGQEIVGATSPTLTIWDTSSADLGDYQLVASNELGTVDSDVVSLDLIPELGHFIKVVTHGYGTVDFQTGQYPDGEVYTVTATSVSGNFEFLNWTGDVAPEDVLASTITIVADQNRVIHAHFGAVVPNDWLTFYGIVDVDADDDGDGFTNRQEFELGTDPTVDDNSDITTKTIALRPGWNMISLPLQPEAGRSMRMLLDTTGRARVWYWDTLLGELVAGGQAVGKRGYWMYLVRPIPPITITGREIVDTSIRLFPGWNLVGPVETANYVDNPAIDEPIWAWNRKFRRYVPLSNRELQECFGYWIHVTEETVLEFE